VPRIHLLDANLANQIAAGEVIERPAAVVKELVENALDAGAKRVEVDLQDGGRRLIRVRDDGCGMGREDAALSLQRHATSKLRSKDDLFAIGSYGFRGEALPSMAAVSRFSLLTCEPGALRGTRVEVEGGSPAGVTDAGAPAGTMVEVRDLFWNVPARRKFLKKAQTEQAQCVDAVLRLALPRPDVTFFVREGDRALAALHAGADVIAARAEEALGREVRDRLVPFAGQSRGMRAHGLAVSPAVEYGSARNVWLFVNGRAIRDRALTHAVLRAYGELMPHGRYPGAIVFLEVPPGEVDVNVHPAKAEVRLADPKAAWEAIHSGLTEILARGDWMPRRQGTTAVAPARVYSLGDPAERVAEHAGQYADASAAIWKKLGPALDAKLLADYLEMGDICPGRSRRTRGGGGRAIRHPDAGDVVDAALARAVARGPTGAAARARRPAALFRRAPLPGPAPSHLSGLRRPAGAGAHRPARRP